MSIKTITVQYDNPKPKRNFSRGDTLTGRVTLELSKDTKIESLCVRAKGKASVFWTEHRIYAVVSYKAKEHFFSINNILLEKSRAESKVLPAGNHVFPFEFNIPDIHLPEFWVGRFGSISYSLEARASRSFRPDRKDKTMFFVESAEDYSNLDIMRPQQGADERKGAFSSGKMSLSVATKKMGYLPGESLEVTTLITNNSKDSKVTPKYIFYEKQSFFCKNKRKVHTKYIVEEKGELVQAGEQQTQTKVLQIPDVRYSSLLNCNIVKQEYRLKVYLEGPLYSPEVKLPIIVLPKPKKRLEQCPEEDQRTEV